MNDQPDPAWDEYGVPHCRDECAQYDGKRCKLLGFRPGGVCEPAVFVMAQRLKVADAIIERVNKELESEN